MMMLKKRNLIILLIAALVAGMLISGCGAYFIARNVVGDSVLLSGDDFKKLSGVNKKYEKLEGIYQYITQNYYVPADEKELEEGMYRGLIWGLGDPYSSYLNAEEYDQMMISTSGEYDGVGVTMAPGTDGYITVVAPMHGSPAFHAGIKAKDRIVKIDGKKYDNATMDEAAVALRGKSGTKVKVSVMRGDDALDFELTRTKIVMETVTSKVIEDNIGYIKISAFEENTSKDFEVELRSMEVKGVKGLVIDLRENGGGLVQMGTEIADMLLPSGLITYTENRKGEKSDFKSDASYTDLPYTVLIDGGTASTSEIIAAAIKDHKTAKLVGTKTYGKGIIQSVEQLKDGDAIKMTIMQYFSPDGNVIHEKGVAPDVTVENTGDAKVDEQLEKALEILKK